MLLHAGRFLALQELEIRRIEAGRVRPTLEQRWLLQAGAELLCVFFRERRHHLAWARGNNTNRAKSTTHHSFIVRCKTIITFC